FDGSLIAAAVVPVTLGGRTIGSLLIGEALTRKTLTDMQATLRGSVTFFVDNGASISTLADPAAITRVQQSCGASQPNAAQEVEVAGTPHLVAALPLVDITGKRIGCIALTGSRAAPYAVLAALQRWLLAFGILFTALGVLAAAVTSARLVQPIH